MTAWTPEQAAIIGHPLGAHALVHAAPGAGKTTTLVGRVARLVAQADVARIRVVMFNKAIQETFAERLERAGISGVKVTTFDALGLEVLGRAQRQTVAGVEKDREVGHRERAGDHVEDARRAHGAVVDDVRQPVAVDDDAAAATSASRITTAAARQRADPDGLADRRPARRVRHDDLRRGDEPRALRHQPAAYDPPRDRRPQPAPRVGLARGPGRRRADPPRGHARRPTDQPARPAATTTAASGSGWRSAARSSRLTAVQTPP